MKALTIQQPWATLIALGEKRFETRSRKTNIRGPIAIHAGKKIDHEACEHPQIKHVLDNHGLSASNLPIGAVIAIAELENSYEMTYVDDSGVGLQGDDNRSEFDCVETYQDEYAFGWYEEGRHAWELSNVKAIDPITAKGQQGWWNWESEFSGGSL